MTMANDNKLDRAGRLAGQPETDLDAASLGDEATLAGSDAETSSHSLGDEVTFGDVSAGQDFYDDGIDVVDLEARYTVEGTLGKGGMGEVLLATDTRLNRQVAIKRILGEAARSKTAVSRFLTEAQSVAALNHQNVVQIYDYGRAKDGPFLIMEYVKGSSLLDRIKDGPLPLEEAVKLTCQLCEGLSKAHAAGIVHRDIKPANVLLTEDNLPKLTDFGLAKDESADTGMTMEGAVLGTLDFMPPEQRQCAAHTDARSDQWSLAATLYQMVTGKSPRVIKFKEVPETLQDALGKALEDKKDDRFETVYDFQEALKTSLGTSEQLKGNAINLADGECQQCHTKNQTDRKFCRGCGEALRMKCLSCDCENPIWETFCADCGGNQEDLLKERLGTLQEKCEKAESLRQGYEFTESLAIANEIADLGTGRFKQFREWSETFKAETVIELQRHQQIAKNKFTESKTHRKEYDYVSAINAIETIRESMRSPEISSYLKKLKDDFAKSKKLLKVIAEKVKKREIEDLLPLVNNALELRGDRPDLRKLQQRLHERSLKRNEIQSVPLVAVTKRESPVSKVKSDATTLNFDKKKGLLVAGVIGGIALLFVVGVGVTYLSLMWEPDAIPKQDPFSAAEELGETVIPEVVSPEPGASPFAPQSPN
ncbi:serine/threonine-protein kinase [Mariniblastus sp.]|nr:serine/threonine-protein kinase [Mariniblastus sp.]